MEILTNQQHQTRCRSPFPGFIDCPQCGLGWIEEYVPEFCPECGSRVSYKAGTGMEDMVDLIKKAKLPINILQCPNCKLLYPQVRDKKSRICFRCQFPLVNSMPLRNVLRKVLWHSRSFGKILRGQF